MLQTHSIYGRLAYLNDTGYGSPTFIVTGTDVPLIVVEVMIMNGCTPREICTGDWESLHDREDLVTEIARIHASIPPVRAA